MNESRTTITTSALRAHGPSHGARRRRPDNFVNGRLLRSRDFLPRLFFFSNLIDDFDDREMTAPRASPQGPRFRSDAC